MKLLLDTHTFIFWDSQPSKLSTRALKLLTDKDNLRLLSVVSLWEIQSKQQLGKLTLNKTLEEIIIVQQNNYMEILPIIVDHILALDRLPMHHKDPNDIGSGLARVIRSDRLSIYFNAILSNAD